MATCRWVLGWLAFLPNSPYLVTDLVHLGEGVELWRHVLQYGFAAWTGIMLGVVSMRLVHQRIEREWGAVFGWAAVVVSVGLCSIGVVIGRFQRWNSWDLVTRPDAVVAIDLRVGTFSVRIRPVDRGGACRGGILRAGVPDHLVTRGARGRVESADPEFRYMTTASPRRLRL